MATVGSLVINVMAETGKFNKGMRQSQTALKAFETSANSVSATLRRFAGAALAAAGVAGLGVMARNALNSADALAKTADKLGLTTQALAGLQHAGDLSGVSINTMNMALQRMVRRVAEAAVGTGEAKGALQELGIDAQRLAQLSPDQQMQVLADAFANVGSQGDRVRLAMRLFDSEGVSLVNTLAMGSAGLQKAASDAERFGLAISRPDAAKIEAANDAITRLKAAVSGAVTTFIAEFAPTIEDVATRIANWTSEMKDRLIPTILGVINFLKEWGPTMLAAAAVIGTVIAAVKAYQAALKAVAIGQSIVLALSGPAGWAQLAAGAAIAGAAVAAVAVTYDELTESIEKAQQTAAATPPPIPPGAPSRENPLGGVGADTTAAAEAAARNAKSIEDITKELERQRDTFGMTAVQIKIYDAALAGANEEELARIQRIADEIKQMELLEDARERELAAIQKAEEEKRRAEEDMLRAMEDDAKHLTEEFMDPMDKFKRRVEEIMELSRRGLISPETTEKAIAKLEKDFSDFKEEAGQVRLAAASEFGSSQAASIISQALAPVVKDPIQQKQLDELEKIVKAIKDANRNGIEVNNVTISSAA